MQAHEIKALVLRNWEDHPRCKFYPGDIAEIGLGEDSWMRSSYSKALCEHSGEQGKIVAVTCTEDGKIRGMSKNYYPRCLTRYYVEFEDGHVHGYPSQHLHVMGR